MTKKAPSFSKIILSQLKKDHYLLWVHSIAIACGFSLCSIQENFLFTLPFWSNHWQSGPEILFIYKPYGLLITSITILFLGLFLRYLNIFTTKNEKAYSQKRPSILSLKRLSIYNNPSLLILFIIYFITIVLQSLLKQPSINLSPPFKEVFYFFSLGIMLFTSFLSISVFPPLYACITYAIAALVSIGLYKLTLSLAPQYTILINNTAPFLALALFIIGIPQQYTSHYQSSLSKKIEIKTLFSSKKTLQYVSLCLLGLLSTFQFYLNATVSPSILIGHSSGIHYETLLMIICQMIGAIFAAVAIKSKNNAPLVLLIIILGLVGIGTILHSLLIDITLPITLLWIASGMVNAFCIMMFSILLHSQQCIYTALSIAIFVMNIVGYFSGYALWNISLFIKEYSTAIIYTDSSILGLAAVISILFIQSLHYYLTDISQLCYVLNLHKTSIEAYIYHNRLKLLTRREKEILHLVQQGLKNIEISSRLSITDSTLRVHLRNTYRKLNLKGGREILKKLPYDTPSI